MKKIIPYDIRTIQIRPNRTTPYVHLPKGIFSKGDTVLVTPIDSESVLVTKRVPRRGL
jgi:hypothetical protein